MSFTPPLSSTTYVIPSSSRSSIHFTRPSPSSPSSPPAEVWTNFPLSTTWRAFPFVPSTSLALKGLEVASIEYDELGEEGEFEFTYRLNWGEDHYEWLGDTRGNGRIIVVSSNERGEGKELEFEREWEEKGEGVWVGRFEFEGGKEREEFGLKEVVERWAGEEEVEGLVLEQSSRTWFIPRHLTPSSPSNLVSQISTSFASPLLLLRTLPSHSSPLPRLLVLYPFSTEQVASSLKGSNEKGLVLECMREGADSKEFIKGGCVIVSNTDKEGVVELIRRAVEGARECLYPNHPTSSTSTNELNNVSLCTWNALGPTFTLSSLLSWLSTLLDPKNTTEELIDSFKEGGVLLDDGWQDTLSFGGREGGPSWNEKLRGLRSFGVREGWFDVEFEGLKEEGWELRECVKRVKGMGVRKVGVWITTTGYWNCLHPSFDLFPTTPATFSSPPHDSFHYTSNVPTLSSVRPFFATYFDQLKSSGISFIKIDNQALIDTLISIEDGTAPGVYRAELLKVVQEEGKRVFGQENVTHCMAHSTRIWSGPLALSPSTSTQKPVLRNSDDYFPQVRDSHRWHIYINSINLLLTRNLNFAPDLDMAQEGHEYGSFHIAARAFCTAGLYCTDGIKEGEKLGENENGWRGILGRSKKGWRVIQAKEKAGCVLGNQVFERKIMEGGEGGEALKIGLKCERAEGATIGLWNCQAEGEVRGNLMIEDVQEVIGNQVKEDCVLFVEESFGGLQDATPAPSILSLIPADSLQQSTPTTLSTPLATTLLPPHSVQLARIVKLSKFPIFEGGKEIKIACLGLRDKFVGLEAIRSIEIGEVTPEPPVKEKKKQVQAPQPVTKRSSLPSPSLLPSTRSSFPAPPPGTHVPFLLTYFSNLFSPRSSSSQVAQHPSARTPSSELSSLFKSFLRRPISTFLGEVRGIFSFGLAVVVWAFRSRRNEGVQKPSQIESQESKEHQVEEEPVATEEEEEEEVPVVVGSASATTVLRVELEFISAHLAFYTSPSLTSSTQIEVKLDGKTIEERWIKVGDSGLIEIDVESAWTDGGKRTKLGSDVWIVEVAYRG